MYLDFLIHPRRRGKPIHLVFYSGKYAMHHIRVAVATQEHYQKSGRHLKNCRGPCESESSPYKSIYSQSTARSDMKLWP